MGIMKCETDIPAVGPWDSRRTHIWRFSRPGERQDDFLRSLVDAQDNPLSKLSWQLFLHSWVFDSTFLLQQSDFRVQIARITWTLKHWWSVELCREICWVRQTDGGCRHHPVLPIPSALPLPLLPNKPKNPKPPIFSNPQQRESPAPRQQTWKSLAH